MDPQYTGKFLGAVGTAAHPDHQALLHAVYDTIIRHDFDAFGELLTDDVELNICGFPPMDGAWRGREQVVAATRNNFEMVDTQQPQVQGMISQGGTVAVLFKESGVFKSDGRKYSLRCVQWFTFVGGKLKSIDEIAATVQAQDVR
jgi:ketosteroid isomerase-like protein